MTSKGARSLASAVLTLAAANAFSQTTQPAVTAVPPPVAAPVPAAPNTTATVITANAAPNAAPTTDLAALVQGDPAEGIATLRDRLKVNPRDGQACHAIGYLLLKTSKASEAAGFLTRAENCGVSSRALAYNQALAFLRTGVPVRAAGIMAKHFQNDGANADERFVDLFGDSMDRAVRSKAISNQVTQKTWDDLIASRIAVLEHAKPGKHKWGTQWLSASEWSSVESSIRQHHSKVSSAERAYEDAVENRKNAESELRIRDAEVPDANSAPDRVAVEIRNRAREHVRQAKSKEAAAKIAWDAALTNPPRATWEDHHAPIWGDVGDGGVIMPDAGATLATGMSVEDVHLIMGVQPSSLSENESGIKTRLYDLPDRTVYVRFRDERVISFDEQVKTKFGAPLLRSR